VLELPSGLAGAYCGKLFADAGADVVKGESPSGDAMRGDPALFAFLNTSKRSVLLGGDGPPWRWPDVVIVGDDHERPSVLGETATRVRASRPELVTATITPFGCTGPWADYAANEFTVQAWCGSSGRRGEPAREPLAAGGRMGEYAAGLTAAVGALAALVGVRRFGVGDHVDVSMLEAATTIFNAYMTVQAELVGRGSMPAMARYLELPSVERAADGWVGFATNSAPQFRAFAEMVEHPEWADDPELSRADRRGWHVDELRPAITAWTSARPVADILDRADAANIPSAPVGNGAVLPELEHLRARDIWVENPGAGFVQPRAPYRLSVSPLHALTAAPAPGADTDAVAAEPPRASDPVRDHDATGYHRPLDGMRVFDLTTYWAGPYAAQIFGWLGADVIKVESVQRPDGTRLGTAYATKGPEPWEEAPLFHGANTGKRDITLDMTRAEGQALARRLLDQCDVLIENFTPRVVERFGIIDVDPARRPAHLVVARMPAWGLSGPWRDRPGFAQNMEQVTGLAWVTGYRDGPPVVPRGPCDPLGGLHAAFAVLACLWVRERSGIAQSIEAPLVDSAVNVAAQQVIDFSARGHLWERAGNRGPLGAPQGVYACATREAWLALSIEDDAQWVALCNVLGRRDWREYERFADDASRRAHHDELDELLGDELRRRELEVLVGELRSAGVPVAEVVRPEDVATNPQLRARGFFETLRHPAAGKVAYPGFGARSANRVAHKEKLHTGAPPLLGQHNRDVLGTLLGLSDPELAELERTQVIGTRPLGR
jgi:crotonobetainyl-CoA:carnitine CoA-transferase CaiB-like acyl-CoA transferase